MLVSEAMGPLGGVTVNRWGPGGGECAYERECAADCQAEHFACVLEHPDPPGGPAHEACNTALENCLNPACCLF